MISLGTGRDAFQKPDQFEYFKSLFQKHVTQKYNLCHNINTLYQLRFYNKL